MIFFLIGYMGCGKSSIGRPLARRLGMRFLDMDIEIEQRAGMSVSEFFAQAGEQAFREMEREVLRELPTQEAMVVATGGGTPCFFDNMELMNRLGVTLYFKLSAAHLTVRLEQGKSKRPLLRDKNQQELECFIEQALLQREPFYNQAKVVVCCDHLSDEYIANHVMMYIENHKIDAE